MAVQELCHWNKQDQHILHPLHQRQMRWGRVDLTKGWLDPCNRLAVHTCLTCIAEAWLQARICISMIWSLLNCNMNLPGVLGSGISLYHVLELMFLWLQISNVIISMEICTGNVFIYCWVDFNLNSLVQLLYSLLSAVLELYIFLTIASFM